jgi:Protein of unknown function with PCYCGC motif
MFKRGLMLVFVISLIFVASSPWALSEPSEESVPAFHSRPPAAGESLPPILDEKQLAAEGVTEPVQLHSYALAAKISKVIYQQPCYCYCDRNHGHKSLHTCFESTHGAMCGTCMAEVIYSYKMSKQHWTAAQIRNGIIRGDWKLIDLKSASSIE